MLLDSLASRVVNVAELVLGLYLAGCLLLVGSGISKLRSSRSALEALRVVWAGAPAPTARILGLAELAVGLAGILAGSSAWMVASLYVALALFAAVAIKAGGLVPCGCFGKGSASIHGVHVVLNVGFAAAALGVAASDSGSSWSLSGGGLRSVLVWALSALCAWLAFVAMTAWVDVADAMKKG